MIDIYAPRFGQNIISVRNYKSINYQGQANKEHSTQIRHKEESRTGPAQLTETEIYLGAQTVLVPLITGEAIGYKELALPQYPDTLLGCV